jgi:predicted dehydrogenase
MPVRPEALREGPPICYLGPRFPPPVNPPPVAAVVGTGFIGPVHVEALRRLAIRVKGVLGSSAAKSSAAAAALGLERGYADYAELLADREVSVVHLASPNRLHHAQVLAALGAGKHVVCEKPLCMTSRESAEVVAAAARHPGLVCAVNYNVRFYPLALHARAMVRRGELGDILHVHGGYAQDWLLRPTDFNWRVLAEEGGSLRAVGDIGTHWLDLVLFITGLELESVMADLRTVHPVRHRPPAGSVETFKGGDPAHARGLEAVPVTTEDCGSVLLRFKGGARGAMTVSQVTAGRKNCIRFEMAGSRRALAWDSEVAQQLWIGERGEPSRVMLSDPALIDPSVARFAGYPGGHNEGFPDTFKQLYRAVYEDVRAGGRPADALYAGFADGHRELLLCEAIAESHRRGGWVAVKD